MAQQSLAGSRIRERRVMAGIRQAELARRVGISGSYLNLIEHNRRRIGGKLMVDIANALEVEPSLLSEGAEAALLSALREAAAVATQAMPEIERADEFAGRFPGWASLIAQLHSRQRSLEHTVATLTDRLTHDPHLATSMHEMLSIITAIRSMAGILADTKEIEPEWRNRFHRNLNEESLRLADGAQKLVAYLDAAGEGDTGMVLPIEEVEALVAAHGFQFDHLAEMSAAQLRDFIAAQSLLTTEDARAMAFVVLDRLRQDARLLPFDTVQRHLTDGPVDPVALANTCAAPFGAVLRRLATLSDVLLPRPLGLVMCDGAGSMMLRKSVDGFGIPRFAGADPTWPLFQALSRPTQPLHQTITVTERGALHFECYAVAEVVGEVQINVTPLYHSFMLIVPQD
ncbi:helix-turn-helix domain-containing protein [Shimia sp. R11_0]|uniref:helix-turn-helix domain-containing protein n=1 Tax=Shimia sp. R11_0 TaxID=2821096 RepID=UPI001ADB36FA|nr:XRE family transcriptional regulator [Shimia sp. R11_0]MBO9477259.1 helix-turn-helix domain-containing protein [Shimia sp. R11_0]